MRRSKKRDSPFLTAYFSALKELSPVKLLRELPEKNSAVLCWGKVAEDFYSALPPTRWDFVISPKKAEHPIPGPGSFRAGKRLIHFFEELREYSVESLNVYLSGGASSLAWIPAPDVSCNAEVIHRLKELYRRPLNVQELNRERAKLCQLKSGGTARIAKSICPDLKIKVFYVSDVSPFGPEILGGGPFFSPDIPHVKLADNSTLRKLLADKMSGEDLGFLSGPIDEVFSRIRTKIKDRVSRQLKGVFIWGCEPSIRLPVKSGRGGRQTHLASLLLIEFSDEILAGNLDILCMSSDGVDGASEGAGVVLGRENLVGIDPQTLKKLLNQGLEHFGSAQIMKSIGALVPVLETGTNVQDIVVIRIPK